MAFYLSSSTKSFLASALTTAMGFETIVRVQVAYKKSYQRLVLSFWKIRYPLSKLCLVVIVAPHPNIGQSKTFLLGFVLLELLFARVRSDPTRSCISGRFGRDPGSRREWRVLWSSTLSWVREVNCDWRFCGNNLLSKGCPSTFCLWDGT